MPINSTPISFQDLQDFYGGGHPISLSEYYRGGGLVPVNRTVTALAGDADNGSSVGTFPHGGITVVVSSSTVGGGLIHYSYGGGSALSFGTSADSSLPLPLGGGTFTNLPYTVTANDSYIAAGQFNSNDDSTASVSFSINGGSFTSYRASSGVGTVAYLRGPQYQNGDQPSTFSPILAGTVSAGDTINVGGGGDRPGVFQVGRRTPSTVYNHTITNGTGQILNLTSSPWGNNSSFGTTPLTSNGNSSPNWSWSFPDVMITTSDANANIPSSGSISMSSFTSITNPTP